MQFEDSNDEAAYARWLRTDDNTDGLAFVRFLAAKDKGLREAAVARIRPQLGAADSFLLDYTKWSVTQTDGPVEYHILGGLTLLSSVMASNIKVKFGTSSQAPNLFSMLVGGSGRERKSWSMGLGESLVRDVAPDRVGMQFGSYEGLIDSLQEQRFQVVFDGEFSRLLASAKGVASAYGQLKTGLTGLYDSTYASRRTKKSGVQNLGTGYRLCILAAISESYLSEYTEPADFTGGFLSRWIFAFADRERFMAETDGSPEAAAAKEKLKTKLKLIFDNCPAGSFEITGSAARALFVQRSYELDVQAKGLEIRMRGLFERAAALLRRVAALLAVDRMVNREGYRRPPLPPHDPFAEIPEDNWTITLEDLETANEIVLAHLRAGMRIVEKVAHNDTARAKAQVLAAMDVGRQYTIGELTAATGMLKKRVSEIVETLMEEQNCDKIQGPGKVGNLYYRLDRRTMPGEAAPPTVDVGAPAGTIFPSVPIGGGTALARQPGFVPGRPPEIQASLEPPPSAGDRVDVSKLQLQPALAYWPEPDYDPPDEDR